MTGFGEARATNERRVVSVEIRSVNNRHLKVSVRAPDSFLSLENDIERLIRQSVQRGTVNVSVRVDRMDGSAAGGINLDLLKSYWTQLQRLSLELHVPPPHDLAAIVTLPGVIGEERSRSLDESDWPLVQQALEQALKVFHEFRVREGQSMHDEMSSLCDTMAASTNTVAVRAPLIVSEYRTRLKSRLEDLLRESGVEVDDHALIRETAMFADRCDVTEEVSRLRAHISQFRALIDGPNSPGRKLDFLCQEMLREVNTIGSKANDTDTAHTVVEAKSALEKIRELVQNIE